MISILIPTKNRHEYIKKLIKFYITINFTGIIHIFDSSNNLIYNQNKKLIDSTVTIKVKLYKIQSTTLGSIAYKINFVKTNYSIITGDDDYLIINDIKKIENEFKRDKKIIAVGGSSLLISKSPDSEIYQDINFYPLNNIQMIDPIERLFFSIKNYRPNIFLVIKTKNIKKIFSMIDFKDNNKNLLRTAKDELAFSYILPFMGKIKILKQNFMLRTGHGKNLRLLTFNLASKNQINYSKDYIIKSLIKTSKSLNINLSPKTIKSIEKYLYSNFFKKEKNISLKFKLIQNVKNIITQLSPYFLKKLYYKNKISKKIDNFYNQKLIQNSTKLPNYIKIIEDH